jgi:chorismate mutase
MPGRVRAIRGAVTLEEDTPEQVRSHVQQLVRTIFERNGIGPDEVISVIFTATDDIGSLFPATAAREMGLDGVPLMCARELDIQGGLPLCVRLLMHVETESPRVEHVYLGSAKELRRDLAQ